jgi:hypothetical protein
VCVGGVTCLSSQGFSKGSVAGVVDSWLGAVTLGMESCRWAALPAALGTEVAGIVSACIGSSQSHGCLQGGLPCALYHSRCAPLVSTYVVMRGVGGTRPACQPLLLCACQSLLVVRCIVLCCAVLCCAVLCCAVLCCAVLCCAVLCCAVLCCAVPAGAVKAREWAVLLSVLAKQGITPPPAWQRSTHSSLQPRLRFMTALDLSMTVWALPQLGVVPRAAWRDRLVAIHCYIYCHCCRHSYCCCQCCYQLV